MLVEMTLHHSFNISFYFVRLNIVTRNIFAGPI